MADDVKKAAAAGTVAAPINRADVEQKVSYIGARLREKSTYAGLSIALGFALPYLSHYVPGLSGDSAASIVDAISSIGIGVGTLIAIFLPEKGSPVGKINSLSMGIVLFAIMLGAPNFVSSARAQTAAAVTAPTPPAALVQLQAGLNTAINAVNSALILFLQPDLQAAQKDATSFNIPGAAACWGDLLKLGVPNIPPGAGIAYALQRAIDLESMQTQLHTDCGAYLPKFVALIDTAIIQYRTFGP